MSLVERRMILTLISNLGNPFGIRSSRLTNVMARGQPFAVLAWVVVFGVLSESVRHPNLALFMTAITLLFLAFFFLQFHCLDCGRSGDGLAASLVGPMPARSPAEAKASGSPISVRLRGSGSSFLHGSTLGNGHVHIGHGDARMTNMIEALIQNPYMVTARFLRPCWHYNSAPRRREFGSCGRQGT